MNRPPACHAAPGPERDALALAAPALQLADAVHHVERFEQGGRHWHGAIDTGAALLQAFDHQHAGGQIDAIDGQRQGFRQTAAGIGQGHAERPHLAVGRKRFGDDTLRRGGCV
jgi:hypothetical protein